ncbi:hypothetical protein PIB30_034446 [Stylosanthes scabra]|uniref:Retrotransposon Copia-like N-terminal domain-containing protein n=1 Tax=Stylosanthes scabra TaxID=79078 RepID=A0ABU6TD04_9FABA|nr:hypothetical protein [Stylosanthes scabra]
MALIPSSQLKIKNGLVLLTDKLDDDNFWTWKKSVLLTIRTLKLVDHLDPAKAPIQFEKISSLDTKDAKSSSQIPTTTDGDSRGILKKSTSDSIKILQELENVVVITIHPPLSAAITFAPELRLTYRLRLHEACSVFFDSIPLGSMLWGMISEAYELATPATIDGVCASSTCG